MSEKLSVYEFGRELLRRGDLDPVYICLHEAQLDETTLRRWLLAYWCFYHMGTASWTVSGPGGSRIVGKGARATYDYWTRMETAAESKEYPRCPERRHFRGDTAKKSIAYLAGRGSAALFDDLLQAGPTAGEVMKVVQQWVGFGPWISFKVADMLERLGIRPVEFDVATAMYEGSPTEGAQLLHRTELPDKPPVPHVHRATLSAWAVNRILHELGSHDAPPRYERPINVQEAETILCKWKSYMSGHYHLGEDIASCRRSLLRFAKCKLSQVLLVGGKKGGLW